MCAVSKESYFSKNRLRNALIGSVVGFFVIFLLFAGLQYVGILLWGGGQTLYYSLWAALIFGVVSFFAVLLLTPRKYLGPFSEVPEETKVNSVVETKVEAMEKDGAGHLHVKGERKEEDVLKHLEESHEPQDTREES